MKCRRWMYFFSCDRFLLKKLIVGFYSRASEYQDLDVYRIENMIIDWIGFISYEMHHRNVRNVDTILYCAAI